MTKLRVERGSFSQALIVFVIILRIASGIYIFFNPVLGLLLFWIFDYFDAYILQYRAKMSWNSYQDLDKKLDWFGYTAMLLVGIKFGQLNLFLMAFLFRVIGQVIFLFNKRQKIFIFFPNFVEALFIWFVVFRTLNINTNIYGLPKPTGLIILFVLSILREYFLHVFWPNYLRKNGFPRFFRIFGIKKSINWG